MLGRVEPGKPVGRQCSGIHVGTGAAVAPRRPAPRAAATQALGIEGGRASAGTASAGRCGAEAPRLVSFGRSLRTSATSGPGGRGLWRDGRPALQAQPRPPPAARPPAQPPPAPAQAPPPARGPAPGRMPLAAPAQAPGALGLADTGAGAGAVSQPDSRRNGPQSRPDEPARCRCGRHHRCSNNGRQFRAQAGLTGAGAATGTGSGAGSGAGVTSCHCDASPVSTTGRASAASGAATGAPGGRRAIGCRRRNAVGVTGCAPTAPSRPAGAGSTARCRAGHCRPRPPSAGRDSSVSKSKMATSATSSPLGAKLLRPELEKKKSSTACVRGQGQKGNLQSGLQLGLPLTTGSRSWGIDLDLESSRQRRLRPARRHRTVARDQPLGHRGLRGGVVAAVAIDRQQLAQDLVVLRRASRSASQACHGHLPGRRIR